MPLSLIVISRGVILHERYSSCHSERPAAFSGALVSQIEECVNYCTGLIYNEWLMTFIGGLKSHIYNKRDLLNSYIEKASPRRFRLSAGSIITPTPFLLLPSAPRVITRVCLVLANALITTIVTIVPLLMGDLNQNCYLASNKRMTIAR